MFGFLKNKIKEWVDKAKDTLKPEEKIEETKEETKKEEKPKEQKKAKPEKQKKEKKKKAANLESSDLGKSEIALKEKPEPAIPKKQGFISKLFGKKPKEEVKEEIKPLIEPVIVPKLEKSEPAIEKKSFFQKVKKTFTYKISEDDFNKLFEDLDMLLLENNVALEVVEDLKKSLSKKLIGKEIKKDRLEHEIKNELKNSLNELILDPEDPIEIIKQKKEKPFVILFFGINGTGKTTSIAKIASLLKENNLSVVLAAADTFRAASIEQITEHANKLQVPLIKHDYQTDPSAVGFDAIKYAKAHRIDVVLIDTAGRMHTKTNLLAEMEKIVRVTAPDLKIFVAESIAGNDATEQAKTFNEMIGIDGSILSKADVDEKGGTIISVSHATKKPIFYLGTGQTYKDLKLFNKNDYVESLGL